MNNTHKVKPSISQGINSVATEIYDETKERLLGITDDIRDKGDELLDEVKTRSFKMIDSAEARGEEVWQGFTGLIRKHPARSVGYAVIAGALLYAFFRPKRSD